MRRFITGVILTLLLAGCALRKEEKTGGVSQPVSSLWENAGEGSGGMESAEPDAEEEEGEELFPAENGGFYYGQLPEAQKRLYRVIFGTIGAEESSCILETEDPADIEPALNAVLLDHPEFFWLDGSASYFCYEGSRSKRLELVFNLPAEEIADVREQIEERREEFLELLDEDADDYEKVRTVYAGLIEETDYVPGSDQNQNIQSVFLNRESVCAGYAKAFQYLLQAADIECVCVTGTAQSESGRTENHSWNLVSIDGEYYWADPTWGDPAYVNSDGDFEPYETIFYDYLCLTTEEMERAGHEPDPSWDYPECTEREYDFYVYEDCFFEEYDEEALSDLLEESVEDEEEPVIRIKYADEEAYEEACDALFGGEESLLSEPLQDWMRAHGESTVSYSYHCDDALYTIRIYIG